MSDFWHKLGCCVVEKAQPVSSPSGHLGLGFPAQGWCLPGTEVLAGVGEVFPSSPHQISHGSMFHSSKGEDGGLTAA